MTALLSVGSNFGNRQLSVECAIAFISSFIKVLRRTPIYESPDCYGSECRYMNAVLEIETELTEESLNSKFKAYEAECGRDAQSRESGEVCVDIDIVKWGDALRRHSDFKARYFQMGLRLLRLQSTI